MRVRFQGVLYRKDLSMRLLRYARNDRLDGAAVDHKRLTGDPGGFRRN